LDRVREPLSDLVTMLGGGSDGLGRRDDGDDDDEEQASGPGLGTTLPLRSLLRERAMAAAAGMSALEQSHGDAELAVCACVDELEAAAVVEASERGAVAAATTALRPRRTAFF
jgi:hypothetical protein